MMNLGASLDSLKKRGPDQRGTYIENFLALGHSRLSILDLSMQGRQPMKDPTENFIIVFNGEIFNFRELKSDLESKGYTFKSGTDTEVLLALYIQEGEKCLSKLNGFFSFAVYNKADESLFIARDRFGIKPLFYYQDEDKFIFSSEMKALLSFNIPREIDYNSLFQYLHYNYIPGPETGVKNCYKLEPGHFLKVKKKEVSKHSYYNLDEELSLSSGPKSHEAACSELFNTMEESVKSRLVADVPVGSFLSGGIDSSIITALASKHQANLKTFTIGYEDHKYFDESDYAEKLAKRYNTDHYTFKLTNKELYQAFSEALEYIDNPFADSSALAYYILSKKVAKEVKVALSGDGADEVFGGYNKHRAEFLIRNKDFKLSAISALGPLWKAMPQSRSGKYGNLFRQLSKISEGSKLNKRERYYKWAGFSTPSEVTNLLSPSSKEKILKEEILRRKKEQIKYIKENGGLNDVFRNDLNLVLANDMLVKADSMSMANSLEVRVPFLDHKVVELAFSMPETYKVNKDAGKQIIRDTFGHLLPEDILTRSKKGFEVPLLNWLKSDLIPELKASLLSKKYIEEQEIFSFREVEKLMNVLYSSNPGDSHARLWAIIVFQYWHKKYICRT